ncbi:MAG: AAA family ATPase [Halanaerobium sp.]
MYYKKIYIRDFGIFQNQTLNNISKNLVVIGGKNRAGKSTFLKLLRYLPLRPASE